MLNTFLKKPLSESVILYTLIEAAINPIEQNPGFRVKPGMTKYRHGYFINFQHDSHSVNDKQRN
jgi:hypothetical protein